MENKDKKSVSEVSEKETGQNPSEDEIIDNAARKILDKYRKAFEELAK